MVASCRCRRCAKASESLRSNGTDDSKPDPLGLPNGIRQVGKVKESSHTHRAPLPVSLSSLSGARKVGSTPN